MPGGAPSDARLRALGWLHKQPQEIMDACLQPLSAAERAQLGLAWNQATAGLPEPQSRQAHPLAARLAASNHKAVAATLAGGPLRAVLLASLAALGSPGSDAPHWMDLNNRLGLLGGKLAFQHQLCLRAYAQWPCGALLKDNTAAILALDALHTGAPDPMECTSLPPWPKDGETTGRKRRQCGVDALLYATFFGAGLQDTLLAHLIVGTALSYVGQIGAAETLLGHAVATRLPEALAPGQGDRGHPFFAELNGHATSPWHSLAMLKVAALEGDSAVLYEICRRAKRFVPKRPDGPAALDPIQKRWQALGHQFELEDEQAVCYAATRGHWRLLAAVGTPWPA